MHKVDPCFKFWLGLEYEQFVKMLHLLLQSLIELLAMD